MNEETFFLRGQRASLIWWQQKQSIVNSAIYDTFLTGSPMKKLENVQRIQKSGLHLTVFVSSLMKMMNVSILLPSSMIEWTKKANLHTAGNTLNKNLKNLLARQIHYNRFSWGKWDVVSMIPENLKNCCWVSRGAWKCYRETWWFSLVDVLHGCGWQHHDWVWT